MNVIVSFIEKYYKHILFIGIILGIVIVTYLRVNKIKKYGRVTIAKVISYEKLNSGSRLRVNVFFNGRKIPATLSFDRRCEGEYMFVKVLPEDPAKEIIFFEFATCVPACILKDSLPYNGWAEIPECK